MSNQLDTGYGVTGVTSVSGFMTALEIRERETKPVECAFCREWKRTGEVRTLRPANHSLDVCTTCVSDPPGEWL